MAKFKRRQSVAEAVKWNGSPEAAEAIRAMGAEFTESTVTVMRDFVGQRHHVKGKNAEQIEVPNGWYVVRGAALGQANRDFWIVAPEVFEAEYEAD